MRKPPDGREIKEFVAMMQASLRTLRIHLCLAQPKMSHRLGMSGRACRQWRLRPRIDRGWLPVILRLNDQFGVSTDWMVSAGLPGHRATTISHRRQEAGLSLAPHKALRLIGCCFQWR